VVIGRLYSSGHPKSKHRRKRGRREISFVAGQAAFANVHIIADRNEARTLTLAHPRI
jgi:hypothetical protein